MSTYCRKFDDIYLFNNNFKFFILKYDPLLGLYDLNIYFLELRTSFV